MPQHWQFFTLTLLRLVRIGQADEVKYKRVNDLVRQGIFLVD